MNERVAALARERDAAGLFLDFDGTVSEIAPTPEEARPLSGVGALLGDLARSFQLVAVVTGRRAAEVSRLLDAPPDVRVFGLYGLEESGAGDGGDRSPSEEILTEVERAAALVPGSTIEHKGPQVAVHYRASADREAARRILLERLGTVAERHGFRVMEGKRVVELAPGGSPDKGDVIERLASSERLRHVLYAGDDVADIHAFDVVDRLAGVAGAIGVKVAVRSAETPERLLEAADMVVDGPAGLVKVLEELKG